MKRPKGPSPFVGRGIVRVLGGVRWVFWYDPFRGVLPPVATPLCAYCGCQECNDAGWELEAMKKPSLRAEVNGEAFSRIESPKLLAKLPTISEVLVQPSWEDNETKGERALLIFVSATLVKLLLKLERPPVKLMVSGRSFDEAFAALETILKGDDIPWEQDAPRDAGRAKKKK